MNASVEPLRDVSTWLRGSASQLPGQDLPWLQAQRDQARAYLASLVQADDGEGGYWLIEIELIERHHPFRQTRPAHHPEKGQ